MSNLANLEVEIAAVKFILRSFARFKDEEERMNHLVSHLDDVPDLDVYLDYPKEDLKQCLLTLQRTRENAQVPAASAALAPAPVPALVPSNRESVDTVVKYDVPQVSASVIANTYPHYYDVFSAVCGPGTFVNNERIRSLCTQEPPSHLVAILQNAIHSQLLIPDTFRSIGKGSESMLVDPYLKACMNLAVKWSGANDNISVEKNPFPQGCSLCSGLNPEPQLRIAIPHLNQGKRFPAAVSEAKGIEASSSTSESQLVSAGGGAVIFLRHLGLRREDCVVPAISLTGSGFKFFAVYLLEPSFPVMVALTDTLSPWDGRSCQRSEAAKWLLRIVSFVEETRQLMLKLDGRSSVSNFAQLDLSNVFLKPVRSGGKIIPPLHSDGSVENSSVHVGQKRSASQMKEEGIVGTFSRRGVHLNEIMFVYEKLYNWLASKGASAATNNSCILFPHGVATVPASDVAQSRKLRDAMITKCRESFRDIVEFTHYPLLVYDFLSPGDGWTNAAVKPPRNIHKAFTARLQEAIELLNAARVAHLDLRSANIMWRLRKEQFASEDEGNDVEMKLIDFDDAVPFGEFVPEWFVETVLRNCDWRYPFQPRLLGESGPFHVQAAAIHNDFYLFVIKAWLDHSDDDLSFDDYMLLNEGETMHNNFFSSH